MVVHDGFNPQATAQKVCADLKRALTKEASGASDGENDAMQGDNKDAKNDSNKCTDGMTVEVTRV